MEFGTLSFILIFMPLLVLISTCIKDTKIKNIILLIFNMIFIGYYQINYLLMYIILMLLTYYISRFVKSNKLLLYSYLILILGILIIFKYYGLINILNKDIALNIIIPLGISFFMFQSIGYMVDVYRSKINYSDSILEFMVFNSLFATFISGPILRYDEVSGYIKERIVSKDDIVYGLERFIIGLAKKVIISNSLALVVSYSYGFENIYNFQISFLALISFTLQLYYDFSGYSDMAIGLCNMLGFKNIKENFNYPYMSKSVSEFWNRWHISLGRFFKDYVYIPMGGNRCSKLRLVFNLFVVWILTGIWHGNTILFVIWGLYYFVIIAFEKILKIPTSISKYYTLIVVSVGWVLFNSDSLIHAYSILRGLINFNIIYSYDYFMYSGITYIIPLLVISIIGCTNIIKKLLNKIKSLNIYMYDIYLLLILFISIILIINSTFSASIYFEF